jgi:hypothetical protein
MYFVGNRRPTRGLLLLPGTGKKKIVQAAAAASGYCLIAASAADFELNGAAAFLMRIERAERHDF